MIVITRFAPRLLSRSFLVRSFSTKTVAPVATATRKDEWFGNTGVAAAILLFAAGTTTTTTWMEPEQKKKQGWLSSLIFRNKKGHHALPPVKDVTCLPHENVTIWYKDNRFIFLMGAINHSKSSADLAGTLVRQVSPDAVLLDINQDNFKDFDLAKRVESNMESGDELWTKFTVLPDNENMLAGEIPDESNQGLMSGMQDPVDKSLNAIFSQLRVVAVKPGDLQKQSMEHLVRALQEAEKEQSHIVLGGRSAAVGKKRSDEAVQKSNRKAAQDLVYAMRPAWNDALSARDNFTHIRSLIAEELPAFYQVTFGEFDAHTSDQLDSLDQFHVVVAIVMMLHASGVEEELQKRGWKHVETWSWATYH